MIERMVTDASIFVYMIVSICCFLSVNKRRQSHLLQVNGEMEIGVTVIRKEKIWKSPRQEGFHVQMSMQCPLISRACHSCRSPEQCSLGVGGRSLHCRGEVLMFVECVSGKLTSERDLCYCGRLSALTYDVLDFLSFINSEIHSYSLFDIKAFITASLINLLSKSFFFLFCHIW